MIKLHNRLLTAACIASIIFGLAACQSHTSKTKYTDYSFDYFDTVTTIVGFEESQEVFNNSCKKIKERLSEYHKLYDIYSRYDGITNLCSINQASGIDSSPIKVDKRIIDLLLYAKQMYSLTDGKINIAMGSVLSIWHRYREEGINDPSSAKLPPIDLLQSANSHTDISKVIIDSDANTVMLSDPEMKLDVGAIAKGYAVEAVAEWMQKNGMSGYILNVGGNVRIVGKRPDNKKWTVGIENPDTSDDEKPYIEYLDLDEMSLVTSGSYQRYYSVDGKKYHHIIDPETLMPGERYLSVSILCKDSGKADALSTALFSTDFGIGKKLIESLDDAEALWVFPDGRLEYSSGFKSFCKESP